MNWTSWMKYLKLFAAIVAAIIAHLDPPDDKPSSE
jgi:hypothetical protein